MVIREEDNLYPVQFRLDKSEIKKLFFRFPNLETIKEDGFGQFLMYSELDNELCKELLLSCPKLREFSVTNEFVTCEKLLKLRRVLTEINFSQLRLETAYDNVAFISSFSQLKSIDLVSDNFDTFEKLLPLFEQLSNLTKLKVAVNHDQNNFAERYLATKSKNEQNLLVKKLATVTDLDWCSFDGLCKNAIKFIPKYLTGLKKISMSVCPAYASISRQQQDLLCNDMLDIFHSVTHCVIYLHLKNIFLPEYLPIILHKINQHPARTDEIKALKLLVVRDDGLLQSSLAELYVKKEVMKSTLIIIKGKDGVDNFIKNVLPGTTPLDDVDFFEFQSLDGEDIDYTIYDTFLNWIKSLKHVYLHVPSSFRETEPMHYTYDQEYDGNIYPQVEQLTIKAKYYDLRYQTLLNRFAFAFPNIRQLTIDSHCGYWQQHLGEFQLVLCKYSLKHLKVDVSVIKDMMIHYLEKLRTMKTYFCVVEIECLRTSKRHCYKVALHNLSTARLKEDDLDGLVRGRDFFRLHITVNDLEQLELYRGVWINDELELGLERNSSYPSRIVKLSD